MIITFPKRPVDGVYVVAQLPEDRVQEVGLNVPPLFPSLQDTIPVGISELELPATVTVNMAWEP